MTDPRSPNARAFRMDGNFVASVELDVLPIGTRYRCTSVRLINEYEAQGRTITYVSVLDRNGARLEDIPIFLVWPWMGTDSFGYAAEAKTDKWPREIVTATPYSPPNKGPLAVRVGDPGESDIVGGLGLPMGHHVGAAVIFEEIDGDASPPLPPLEPPTPPPGTSTLTDDLLVFRQRMTNEIDAIIARYGGAQG